MFKGWPLQFVIGLFILSMGISFLIFSPQMRKWTQGFLFKDGREVLSSLDAQFNGDKYKILKLRDIKGILVEIYKISQESGEIIFIDKSYISDKKDAYYGMSDKKLNLFLKDINDDNIPEIIVPSYDRNLVSHLNIFSFDSAGGKLAKLSEH